MRFETQPPKDAAVSRIVDVIPVASQEVMSEYLRVVIQKELKVSNNFLLFVLNINDVDATVSLLENLLESILGPEQKRDVEYVRCHSGLSI